MNKLRTHARYPLSYLYVIILGVKTYEPGFPLTSGTPYKTTLALRTA